ncbi:MAG: hypothetical protein GX092_01135 [Clostridia bacterium]|nr:hypothetical protein [Clostridia bacterium]
MQTEGIITPETAQILIQRYPVAKRSMTQTLAILGSIHVEWGIEQFFVPERKSREIEAKIRQGVVYAQISVLNGKSRVVDLITAE